jgi:hypothetical protein
VSDDKRLVGQPDRERINVGEPYEMRDACAEYGCTEKALREAVAAVGPMRDDVEWWLGVKPHTGAGHAHGHGHGHR